MAEVMLQTRFSPSDPFAEAKGVYHKTENDNRPLKQWILLPRNRSVQVFLKTGPQPVRVFIVLDGVMRTAWVRPDTDYSYELEQTFSNENADFGSLKVLVKTGVCKPKVVLSTLYTDMPGWKLRNFPSPRPYQSAKLVHKTTCKTPSHVVSRFAWWVI